MCFKKRVLGLILISIAIGMFFGLVLNNWAFFLVFIVLLLGIYFLFM